MYRAFNLTGCDWSKTSRASGDVIYKRNKDSVKKSLESFLNNGIIDGSKLSAHWFPTIKADVFISHSHKDKEASITCASWLKDNFNIDSFIDSCVWGHADDLLKIIDENHCRNGGSYSYQKRNRSTSHVHMMLANALSEMIEACECVVFINSPNSITSKEAVERTQSPWLFYELGTMRIIRRRTPARRTQPLLENFSEGSIRKAAELKIEYAVALGELTPLTGALLDAWKAQNKERRQSSEHPLDVLYDRIAPETK